MRKKILFSFILILTVNFFSGASSSASNDIVITSGELAGIIGKPGVVIIDAREKRSYMKRHLTGAVNLPYTYIIKARDEAAVKKHGAVLSLETAGRVFSELGISNNSTIVVYDSPPSFEAGYVWFTLKTYGAKNVRILSGGIKGWKKQKRPLTKEVAKISPGEFKPDLRSEILMSADWITKNSDDIQLVYAASFEEFIGVRGVGHIPGSLFLWWKDLSNAKDGFKSAREMNEIITNAGISKDKDLVIYCEFGPKASFSYAAFSMLGYKPKFYWGSMVEWQDDPNRPIAKK